MFFSHFLTVFCFVVNFKPVIFSMLKCAFDFLLLLELLLANYLFHEIVSFTKVMSLSSQSTLFYLPGGPGTGTQKTTPNSKFLQSPADIDQLCCLSVLFHFSTIQHLLNQFPILLLC